MPVQMRNMKSYIRRQYKLSVPATDSAERGAFYKGVNAAVEEWCKAGEHRGADITRGDGYWKGKREASATITYDAPTNEAASGSEALLRVLSAKLPQCTYVHYTKHGVWFNEVDLNEMRPLLDEVDPIEEAKADARHAFFSVVGTADEALDEAFTVLIEALS